MSRVFAVVLVWMSLGSAHAARVEVFDRATGKILPTYVHHGRTYVAGEPGHEYELRIYSDAPQRVLAVTTVDGVNVITGQTGAVNQSGYVLDGYGFARIEGWRKSMSRTAAFYFTTLGDSYAARTGRPNNVGVIGVALFREKMPCCFSEEKIAGAFQDEASRDEARRDRPSSSSPQEGIAAAEPLRKRAESKLGTGHGRSEYSAATYTKFERASSNPDETIVIFYDSHRNLVAQGIIPSYPRHAERPQPFPLGFVADP